MGDITSFPQITEGIDEGDFAPFPVAPAAPADDTPAEETPAPPAHDALVDAAIDATVEATPIDEFQLTGNPLVSQPPSVTLAPSTFVYTDDLLLVSVVNANTAVTVLTINIRMVSLAGVVSDNQIVCTGILSTRVQQLFNAQLTAGYIISAVASIGPLGPGPDALQTYVTVAIARPPSATPIITTTLISTFVTLDLPGIWPGGVFIAPSAGPGIVRQVQFPAAAQTGGGSHPTITPANTRWQLLAAFFVLTTDATVGTRGVVLTIQNASHATFQNIPCFVTITAGTSLSVSAAPGNQNASFAGSSGTIASMGMPQGLFMLGSWQIQPYWAAGSTVGAGDQFGAQPNGLTVIEWLDF